MIKTQQRLARLCTALLTMALAPVAFALDNFKVDPRGRLHFDAGFQLSDKAAFGDNMKARRARLGAAGRFDENWRFQIEYDFADNKATAQDIFLSRKLGVGVIEIGQKVVPMGLNRLTSSNDILFIERSALSNALTPDRRLGVRYDISNPRATSQSMVFSRRVGDNFGEGNDAPLGFAQRLVYHPALSETQRLHFGASAAFEHRRDATTVRLRERPEARIDPDVFLVDTGAIDDAHYSVRSGLEAGYQQGPFMLEAEYLQQILHRRDAAHSRFSGYMVHSAYLLTGEQRTARAGHLGGVLPQRAAGAWELAARFSELDLNDGDIDGGRQRVTTLGVNYYPQARIRFMANILFVDAIRADGVRDRPTIFALRAQFHF